jgi:hypothetical protein
VVLENNSDIDTTIKHLDALIVKLRREGKLTPKQLERIGKFYQHTVGPWMEFYMLPNIEMDPVQEDLLNNKFIYLSSLIEKLRTDK